MAKDAGGHGSEARGGAGQSAINRIKQPADVAGRPWNGGAAHSSGIAQATAPITEHQQVPGGNKSWASNYAYQGRDKASGLHKFWRAAGKPNFSPSGLRPPPVGT